MSSLRSLRRGLSAMATHEDEYIIGGVTPSPPPSPTKDEQKIAALTAAKKIDKGKGKAQPTVLPEDGDHITASNPDSDNPADLGGDVVDTLDPSEHKPSQASKDLLHRILLSCHKKRVWAPKDVKDCYVPATSLDQDAILGTRNKSMAFALQKAFDALPGGTVSYAEARLRYTPLTDLVKKDASTTAVGDMAAHLYAHPLRAFDKKDLEGEVERVLSEKERCGVWREYCINTSMLAPHMLCRGNPMLLVVGLFFSRNEVRKLLKRRGLEAESRLRWVHECMDELLAELGGERKGAMEKKLEALRKDVEKVMKGAV